MNSIQYLKQRRVPAAHVDQAFEFLIFKNRIGRGGVDRILDLFGRVFEGADFLSNDGAIPDVAIDINFLDGR